MSCDRAKIETAFFQRQTSKSGRGARERQQSTRRRRRRRRSKARDVGREDRSAAPDSQQARAQARRRETLAVRGKPEVHLSWGGQSVCWEGRGGARREKGASTSLARLLVCGSSQTQNEKPGSTTLAPRVWLQRQRCSNTGWVLCNSV